MVHAQAKSKSQMNRVHRGHCDVLHEFAERREYFNDVFARQAVSVEKRPSSGNVFLSDAWQRFGGDYVRSWSEIDSQRRMKTDVSIYAAASIESLLTRDIHSKPQPSHLSSGLIFSLHKQNPSSSSWPRRNWACSSEAAAAAAAAPTASSVRAASCRPLPLQLPCTASEPRGATEGDLRMDGAVTMRALGPVRFFPSTPSEVMVTHDVAFPPPIFRAVDPPDFAAEKDLPTPVARTRRCFDIAPIMWCTTRGDLSDGITRINELRHGERVDNMARESTQRCWTATAQKCHFGVVMLSGYCCAAVVLDDEVRGHHEHSWVKSTTAIAHFTCNCTMKQPPPMGRFGGTHGRSQMKRKL